mgnify:CR=1 FL=1
MLKKVIKYEDFDGNVREEECYFNYTKAELTKMHKDNWQWHLAAVCQMNKEQSTAAGFVKCSMIFLRLKAQRMCFWSRGTRSRFCCPWSILATP